MSDSHFDTVVLTRVGPRGSKTFTTNDGAMSVSEVEDGRWSVGPTGTERPFATLDSLDKAVNFVLDAREMFRPA